MSRCHLSTIPTLPPASFRSTLTCRDFHAVTTHLGQENSQDSSCSSSSSGGDGGLRDAQRRGKRWNRRAPREGSERGRVGRLPNDDGDRGLSEPDERQEGKHGHPEGIGNRTVALLGTEVRCVGCGVRFRLFVPRVFFTDTRVRWLAGGFSLLPASTMCCSLSLEGRREVSMVLAAFRNLFVQFRRDCWKKNAFYSFKMVKIWSANQRWEEHVCA